ncbi:MAG: DMT family transporter [Desulfuromonas sp.]|nr:DMT family transporter [Desulfuromonas sp.]
MNNIVKAHLLVLLSTLLVAGSFLAADRLAGVINPFSLTLIRFVAAALVLLPSLLSRRIWRQQFLPVLPRAMGISLFYAMFFVCMFEALKTTTSLNTGTIYTLVPFMTALLCLVVLRQKISRANLGIYLLGVVSACWVIFAGQLEQLLALRFNSGDLLFFVGALLICCYSLAMKMLYRPSDSMVVLIFGILFSGAGWMALAMLVLGYSLDWQQFNSEHVWAMAYLVVGATLATVYLYQRSILVLGPRRVMAYVYLNPALVALLLWCVDGVSIPQLAIPGIVLCSVATLLLQWQAHSK